jgi:ribonucleoside-diphosphate reductase alpha chain
MTQTTSGIEPVFMPYYTRRRKVNPNDKNVRVDFVDENGDSWEEYSVFHHKFVDLDGS